MPTYNPLPGPVVVYWRYDSQKDRQNLLFPDLDDVPEAFCFAQFHRKLRLEKWYRVEDDCDYDHRILYHLR